MSFHSLRTYKLLINLLINIQDVFPFSLSGRLKEPQMDQQKVEFEVNTYLKYRLNIGITHLDLYYFLMCVCVCVRERESERARERERERERRNH